MVTLAMVATACGPDVRETAELDPVCGHDGPWRVLELDEDEAPLSTGWGVRRIGDRVYYIVGEAPRVGDMQIEGGNFWPTPVPEHTTLWSTGLCGESPRELARDVWRMFEDERFPDVLFGMTGFRTGDIVAIDPEGIEPPRPFVRDVWLGDPWTDHGVLSVTPRFGEEGPFTLRLLPYPGAIGDEPPDPIVLVEDVSSSGLDVHHRGGHTYVRTEAGEVLTLDLADGSRTTLATGVQSFSVSLDGEYITWQFDGDTDDPVVGGAIDLFEYASGTTTRITEVSNGSRGAGSFDYDYVSVWLRPEPEHRMRVVHLETLETFDGPESMSLFSPVSEGRWVGYASGSDFSLFDPESGEVRLLFDGLNAGGSIGQDYADLMRNDDAEIDPLRAEMSLWRLHYDGEPERLAHRLTDGHTRLADERVLTPVDVDADYLGDLVVVEPGTLAEQFVDDHVFAALPGRFSPPIFDDDGDVVGYAVRDGDRSGVWITRIADL